MYSRYDAVACISAATRASLEAWCAPRTRIDVVSNGVHLDRFRGASPRDNGANRRILTVARLEPQKGLETLIRACPSLPGVRVAIAGAGSLAAPLRSLAVELGVADRVEFLGVRDDIPALLAQADAYVQPSLWEGFGIAAVEAMAAGLPVIASDVPGLAEVVGTAGVLVPPGDAAALARAVSHVLSSQDVRRALSVAALLRAEAFSIRRTHAAYLALYESAARARQSIGIGVTQ